ncbi:MAG TPA: hypothetical protein PL151_00335 [Phycisphaerae bacterium]|nr:hypothetical protein [Phycisphaerae bacterium]HOJ73262.1 hypothetical protein [Phycisphaerae bacterium]HOM51172.1 hypothetical protein [Phycisphaerae bacterium]HON67321.1 hypothetical protein [Phycisphaerae bacterium]HOQ84481.1 hypothetical protein [Phycisphaerae bacterium]
MEAAADSAMVLELDASAGRNGAESSKETPLARAEIEAFQRQLEHLRSWLRESIAKLEADSPATSRSILMDDADAEWQSNIRQRALAEKRLLLNEVNLAFERIRQNTYGRCVNDNARIPRTLLEEMPWARFCESCAMRHG